MVDSTLSSSVKSERKIKRICEFENLIMSTESDKNAIALEKAKKHIDKLNAEIVKIREEYQTHVDQYNSEVRNLRDLNNVQNDQFKQLRTKSHEVSGIIHNQQLIQTLIDGMRAVNIDIKPPKFRDSSNPQLFIDKLEKFFKLKQISNTLRMEFLDEVFDENEKLWYDTQTFKDYNDFKKKFIADFYSVPVRVRMKSIWSSKRFDPSKDQLTSYFLSQVKDAQYFSPPLENYELFYTIIQQLPTRVRELLSTIDFSDLSKITQVLSQLDLTFRDKQENSKKMPSVHSNYHEDRRNDGRGNHARGGDGRMSQGGSHQSSGNRGNVSAKISNLDVSPGRAEALQHDTSNEKGEHSCYPFLIYQSHHLISYRAIVKRCRLRMMIVVR